MSDRWTDDRLDDLANVVRATSAVPLEVATLKQKVEHVSDQCEQNRVEMNARFDKLGTRLWQFFGLIVAPIAVAVIVKVVVGA